LFYCTLCAPHGIGIDKSEGGHKATEKLKLK